MYTARRGQFPLASPPLAVPRRAFLVTWLASAWGMLEDMVPQRARVIAVLEAAGHANRGDHLPVYSGRGAGLRSGIAAALRAGGLEAHELDNRINVPPDALERAVSAGYAAGLEPDQDKPGR